MGQRVNLSNPWGRLVCVVSKLRLLHSDFRRQARFQTDCVTFRLHFQTMPRWSNGQAAFLTLWTYRVRILADCGFLLWQYLRPVNGVRSGYACGRLGTTAGEFRECCTSALAHFGIFFLLTIYFMRFFELALPFPVICTVCFQYWLVQLPSTQKVCTRGFTLGILPRRYHTRPHIHCPRQHIPFLSRYYYIYKYIYIPELGMSWTNKSARVFIITRQHCLPCAFVFDFLGGKRRHWAPTYILPALKYVARFLLSFSAPRFPVFVLAY